MPETNEKIYSGAADRLRAPERIARLEPSKIVDLCLDGSDIRSVLDVGTGTGLFAGEFAARGLDVTGVDINAELLKEAERFVPEARFRTGRMEDLPFDAESFDLAFLGLVFHETDDHAEALAEAHRVARKAVCIAEWPYREEENGPPLHHRVKSESVEAWANAQGFTKFRKTTLSHVVLYRLVK